LREGSKLKPISRRDFVRISAVGAAVAAAPVSLKALHDESPAGKISVWTTAGEQRHAASGTLQWQPARGASTQTITLDSQPLQEILGFGAAFTDAACYTLSRLEANSRSELFHQLFDSSKMGLSVSRICVGASDYTRNLYSYDDGSEPDPELKRFSIEHDHAYILPILREARTVNPNLWLLASPWSPPGWMKANGSMLGGSMRKAWYAAYAKYLQRFLDAYSAEGVHVNSITTQNEVDTDQDGKMPACLWGQEYEIEFVRDHLGPQLASSGAKTDIWILDHNYNLWGRALCELEDEKAREYIKGVAWHGYAGTPDAMTRVQKAYPQISQFWTEGGPDFEKPGYATQWAKWGEQFTGVLRNYARCIIAWNYALDEQGNPNIGPFKCAGLVTVDSKTAAISYSGMYWAMLHFSNHIQRGARVVESSGTPKDVSHVAVINPSGEHVLVLTNTAGEKRSVSIRSGDSTAEVVLPADSVSTLAWS
ncbi:MAG TPA: glycoside hydrolase family 30 beta sandwich domain-containing protein, partial [Terriglobales bacterium]|nr:glycoside hydrolase family 30 beta sandwich domain-containing protein [Terriglobales bacterium]